MSSERTRRVRAGSPPPSDLPVEFQREESEEPDFVNIAIVIAVVSIIFVVAAMAWRAVA